MMGEDCPCDLSVAAIVDRGYRKPNEFADVNDVDSKRSHLHRSFSWFFSSMASASSAAS